jgi:hypothetical protein
MSHHLVTPTPRASSRPGVARWTATAVCLTIMAGLGLVAGGVQASASAAAAPAASSSKTVGKSPDGKMTSTLKGRTAKGDKVTGSFVPTRFKQKNGQVQVKGLVQGVIHQATGNRTFSVVRTFDLASANGAPVSRAGSAAAALATCDILHLVLGPLDLDLLGLQVHLNQVVLDIVAATGAGNLLGNLLCAITGLLDGGPLGAQLGQLVNLLNQILSQLLMGL